MKHFIYIIVAVAFVAMFSTDVASGTALLKTESKKMNCKQRALVRELNTD